MAPCHTFVAMTIDRMTRTTVYLPDRLRARIGDAAAARRVTQAQLIRAWLERAVGDERRDPAGGFLAESSAGVAGPDW